MKPYGVKRNWNETEDCLRNGRAYRNRTHRKILKMLHRRARRLVRLTMRAHDMGKAARNFEYVE